MVAFVMVPHPALAEFAAEATALMLLVVMIYAGVKAFQFGAALYRSLTAWNGDARQQSLFQITTRNKRLFIVAVLVALTLTATLQAYPISCSTMPWWTLEYWWYCSN